MVIGDLFLAGSRFRWAGPLELAKFMSTCKTCGETIEPGTLHACHAPSLEKRQTKGKKARLTPLYGELRGWLDMAYSVRDPDCPFIVSWKGHGINETKTA
jgi:hypothetical protein